MGEGRLALFRRGRDGKCTTCGKNEEGHHGSAKFCYEAFGLDGSYPFAEDDDRNGVLITCFLADVGFTVGKLFPTSYLCSSVDCAKITHNCVMTLAGFLFAAFECAMLAAMARELHSIRSESQSALSTGMVKLLELVLCLAYIIYDVATTEPPGVGTTVLVAFACLAEVLLLCFEGYPVFKYEVPSMSALRMPSMSELVVRGDRTGDRHAELRQGTASAV